MRKRTLILGLVAAWAAVTGGLELPRVAQAMYGRAAPHPAPVARITVRAPATVHRAGALCGDGADCRRNPHWPAWPPGVPAPGRESAVLVGDLLGSGNLVWSAREATFSGDVINEAGGNLTLEIESGLIQTLAGSNTYTGTTAVRTGGTLVASWLASMGVEIETHARVYLTAAWMPAADTVLTFGAGAPAGLLVCAGTLTAPAGGLVTVTGTPSILPQRLIVATALTGSWTAGDLPAGTHLEQGAADLWLVSN